MYWCVCGVCFCIMVFVCGCDVFVYVFWYVCGVCGMHECGVFMVCSMYMCLFVYVQCVCGCMCCECWDQISEPPASTQLLSHNHSSQEGL